MFQCKNTLTNIIAVLVDTEIFKNILLILIEDVIVNLRWTRSRLDLDLISIFFKSGLAPFDWKILFHRAQI